MESVNFFLSSQEASLRCISYVTSLPADGTLIISVREAKHKRSLAQNSLYWGVWMPEIKNRTGHSVDDLHDRFKRTFMVRIYLAKQESLSQERWAELYSKVKSFGDTVATKQAANTVSTTWASMDQFSEYLNQIEHFCSDKGFALPHPEDYRTAMK